MSAPELQPPRVSIVLPTYRGGDRVSAAVDAVRAQTLRDWELILVDDGSDDDRTAAAIERATRADRRVRRLRHAVNRGLPAALNSGFATARGALYSWVADDDRPGPEAFEVMARHLDRHPQVALVYGRFRLCDESGGFLRPGFSGPPADLLSRGNVVGVCFLYRRELHGALGGYRERFALAEDYDFFLRAYARFGVEALERELGEKRHHPQSLTSRHSAEACRVSVAVLEEFRREHPEIARRAGGRLPALMARYAQRGGWRAEASRYLLSAAFAAPLQLGARWADLRWWLQGLRSAPPGPERGPVPGSPGRSAPPDRGSRELP